MMLKGISWRDALARISGLGFNLPLFSYSSTGHDERWLDRSRLECSSHLCSWL